MRPKKTKPPASDKGVPPLVRWAWDQMTSQRITQEEVAKRAGISSTTLRNWCQGRSSPKFMDIEAVVNVLGGEISIKRVSNTSISGSGS